MSDLIERLRRGFGTSAGTKAQREGYQYICLEAADRIAELEAENAKLKADLDFDHQEYKRLRDEMKSEVTRLSDHIRAIAEHHKTVIDEVML